MANIPAIALQNAKNAVKLLNRALADLEEHYVDRGSLAAAHTSRIHKIQANNSENEYHLDRLEL